MANYGRESRMGVNLRRKEKMEKATEFAKKNKKSTGRSRSSFKESTRGDKKTSRKKESRNIESGR